MTEIKAGSTVKILRPKDKADFIGDLLGRVLTRMEGPSGSLTYQVAWWNGRQRTVAVLDAIEVEVIPVRSDS